MADEDYSEYEDEAESIETSQGKFLVERWEIGLLMSNTEIAKAWNLWTRFKKFGIPGNSWLDLRPHIVRVLEILEQEADFHESLILKEKRKNHYDD